MEIEHINTSEILSYKSTDLTIVGLKKLIRSEPSSELDLLSEVIRGEANSFRTSMEKALENRKQEEWSLEQNKLDEWIESDEGKETTSHLASACINLITDDSYNGPPAHDKSHYLKDLYSGLIAIQEDHYRPWEKTAAIIGSLMHDFGKTLEVPLGGKHSTGVDAKLHADVGYFLVERLIKSYGNMPQALADQILYAIVTHQEGKSQERVAQLVQRADREQLVGIEAVRRMFIVDAGLEHRTINTPIETIRNSELALPAKPEDTSLFHHIEFYMRNLYPQIGSAGSARAEDLKVEGGIFLWLSSPEDVRKQIFAPEYAREESEKNGQQFNQGENKFKKVLDKDTWRKIKYGPDNLDKEMMNQYKNVPIEELLEKFVARKNTNLKWKTEREKEEEDVVKNLRKQIINLTEEEKRLLHTGLTFAMVRIEKQESEMVKGSRLISQNTIHGSVENQISNLIVNRYS